MRRIWRNIGFVKNDFEEIFFLNEQQALAGQGKRTLWVLGLILLLTFMALGFAIGSIENLKDKMSNPFTNWVEIDAGGAVSEKAQEMFKYYRTPEKQNLFHLNNPNGFRGYALDFHPQYDTTIHLDINTRTVFGRTIEQDEAVLKKILDPKDDNVEWHNPNFDLNDPQLSGCEVVLSSKLVKRLGYKDFESVSNIVVHDEGYPIILSVAAIVKELPGSNRFITSPRLYNILKGQYKRECNQLISRNDKHRSTFQLLTKEAGHQEILQKLGDTFFVGRRASFTARESFSSGVNQWQTWILSFRFGDNPPLDSVRQFIAHAREQLIIAEYASIECDGTLSADIDCDLVSESNYHHISFHFNELTAIDTFSKELDSEFGIEIDMKQVKSKENFALVSRLTFFVSLILLVFGILSIVLFVNNLLRTHLYEVRSNIGTFQAFGLDNRFLISTYLKIILSFLILAMLPALGGCMLIDRLEHALRGNESLFNIFNTWIVIAIIGLLIVSILLSTSTIRKILGNTPGNLIYKR